MESIQDLIFLLFYPPLLEKKGIQGDLMYLLYEVHSLRVSLRAKRSNP
jgi:hypothetical protein